MSRLTTKQRRARRRRRPVSHKQVCHPVVLPYAGLRFWLDDAARRVPGETWRAEMLGQPSVLTEQVLHRAFEKLKAESERVEREFLERYWGPAGA